MCIWGLKSTASYIGPTINLLLAVLVFGERFDQTQFVSFGLIWVALAIYSADMVRANARRS